MNANPTSSNEGITTNLDNRESTDASDHIETSQPSHGTGTPDGSGKRPVGRRRAKQQAQRDYDDHKTLKLAEEAVEVQKARLEELRRHNEILLFTNTPAGFDNTKANEFFATAQEAVLNRYREESSAARARHSSKDCCRRVGKGG